MIPDYFAIIGSIIAALGGVYYLYETIRGKTKPNKITWLLWGVFPLLTFVAQVNKGVGSIIWASFAAGIIPLLVFAVALINKKAYWKSSAFDYVAMTAGLVSMGLWAITKDPVLAIIFATLADLLAGLPTVKKAFKYPGTESWLAYGVSSIGFGMCLLAVQSFSFESLTFAIYVFAINLVMFALSIRGLKAHRLKLKKD